MPKSVKKREPIPASISPPTGTGVSPVITSVIDARLTGSTGDPFITQSPQEQGLKRRGERAIAAFQHAEQQDAIPRISPGDAYIYGREATRARERGRVLLEPTDPVRVSCGEAMTWDHKQGEASLGATAWIIDTLEHPNTVSAGASGRRTEAARAVGVLEPAIDAAVSARAANALEKMLCHQLAAAHFTAMRLLERSEKSYPDLPPVEVVRLTNAAARMMESFQNGALTLQKLKTGGTQRIAVEYQQVNVATGGQAVVARRVGARAPGRGRKKAR